MYICESGMCVGRIRAQCVYGVCVCIYVVCVCVCSVCVCVCAVYVVCVRVQYVCVHRTLGLLTKELSTGHPQRPT